MKNKEYDFLTVVSSAFIEATNEILNLYHEQPASTQITDQFSIILLEIYQNLMLDIMPSCQFLVNKQKFYSFAILCRSTLDIIIQIKWIISLKGSEQAKAINQFLSFEGVGTHSSGKKFYEWQNAFTKKSTRQIAIELGIDREVIKLPLNNDETEELNLTAFDYLSKITHWNPRLINDLVGFSKEHHIGFTSEYLRMATLALEVFVACATIFTEIFMEQCLRVEAFVLRNKTNTIRTNFQRSFEQYYEKDKLET